MASKRRNVRVKGPTNYSVESTDDEDDDDPERKKAKKKLREMMQEDSDAESDFEKEFGHNNLNLSESDSTDEEIPGFSFVKKCLTGALPATKSKMMKGVTPAIEYGKSFLCQCTLIYCLPLFISLSPFLCLNTKR